MGQTSDPIVFINETFYPLSEARLPLNDYGFLYGVGTFETMRYYAGSGVGALHAHLERLNRSLTQLRISFQVDEARVAAIIRELLERNALSGDAVIKLIVSAGAGPLRPQLAGCRSPALILMATPCPPPPAAFRMSTTRTPYVEGGSPASLKTINYLPYLLAREEARQRGYDDALLLTKRGMVCEGTICNVFFVKEGMLHTPARPLPLLEGITRRLALQIAEEEGIPYRLGAYPLKDLVSADEAFVTNSVLEVVPLRVVNQEKLPEGPLTPLLRDRYRDKVKHHAEL